MHCVVQLVAYTVTTWRASYLLENVWRPATINDGMPVLDHGPTSANGVVDPQPTHC